MTDQTDKHLSIGAKAGLVVFAFYVFVLALAAISEVFKLGWFDYPVFK